MKVPKSTYVMGVVVLGLFGLAIAKSAGGKDRHQGDDESEYGDDDDDDFDDDDDDGDGEDSAESIAEYEREQAMRKTAELEAERELEKLFSEMTSAYGAEAASMGTLFTGITFGGDRAALADEVQDRLARFRRTTHSELTLGQQSSPTVDRIELKPHSEGEDELREQVCDKLSSLLGDTWGSGVRETSTETRIWLNPTTHIRATFLSEYGGCALTFSGYAAPESWINRTPTSVIPVAMIGQPAAKLVAAVKSPIENETITWTGPGLGAGTQPTQLMASVVRGKVAMITVSTMSVEETRLALAEHLTATFGKPKTTTDDSGNESTTWNSKPPVVLVDDGEAVTLAVGKL